MRGLIAAFARNTVFANVVLAIIFLSGLMALFNLNRETFPDMDMDVVFVRVVWPGAFVGCSTSWA